MLIEINSYVEMVEPGVVISCTYDHGCQIMINTKIIAWVVQINDTPIYEVHIQGRSFFTDQTGYNQIYSQLNE